MRVGDRWRVHFSDKLGYGTADHSDIPGYRDLVFDIAVYDIWHPGEKRPAFK
jgi:FKBP-type peptidyl-prolyl cis-trans isomerase FklB